jgi:hypothetical protein
MQIITNTITRIYQQYVAAIIPLINPPHNNNPLPQISILALNSMLMNGGYFTMIQYMKIMMLDITKMRIILVSFFKKHVHCYYLKNRKNKMLGK